MKNTKVISLPDLKKIEEEAVAWFVKLDSERVADNDKAAFKQWYVQSRAHKKEFKRVAAFWDNLQILQELQDYAAADDMKDIFQGDLRSKRKSILKNIMIGSIAASALVGIGIGRHHAHLRVGTFYTAHYQTKIGGQDRIDLPDGTRIRLNTDSILDVVYEKNVRSVNLLKGEAYFEVAKDPERPFSVKTSQGVVTAVGTAFLVRVHEEKISVIVTEGRVALSAVLKASVDVYEPNEAAGEKKGNPVEVSAGQSVLFAQKAEVIDLVAPEVLSKKLDWQDGLLTFRGDSLQDIVSVLGRYTDTVIEISDAELGQQKMVVYYKVGEIETMFEALKLMENIDIEYLGDRHVRIYRPQ